MQPPAAPTLTYSAKASRTAASSCAAAPGEGSPRKPEAYKDIDEVIETSDRAGLARKVARLTPLGVVKG